MNVLALGDVVDEYGCPFVRAALPKIKREYEVDFCIANGENSAAGNGITPFSAEYLFSCGVDVITTGNHCFRRREAYDFFDESLSVLRPFNYPSGAPGRGAAVIDLGRTKIGIINLMGTMYLDNLDNPFRAADEALEKLDGCRIIIVDFHGEATSEKQAMGYYLDGRVSALFGTHTHVQTADERILPHGTGYITDAGMCGSVDSILGIKKEIVISKMLSNMPARFEAEKSGERMINGVVFKIDEKTGSCADIIRINRK